MSPRPARAGSVSLRAAWNLRWLGLLVVGPVLGAAMAGAIFGMPRALLAAAALVLLLDLALFGLLARGERRRLLRGA